MRAPDFNPLVEALKYMGLKPGIDGGDLAGSVDAVNWEKWTGRPHNSQADNTVQVAEAAE